MGTIYIYPHRNEARLSIWKKEDLKWLIKNIFDVYPLLSDYQKERYFRLRYGLLNNITFLENPDKFQEFKNKNFIEENKEIGLNINHLDNWILGIINSEGCFHCRPKKNGKFLLVFQIEHTDKKILEYIKLRFKFTPTIYERAKRSLNQKKTYSLYISSKSNISTLIEFCDNPSFNGLLGNKKIQFENWKRAIN